MRTRQGPSKAPAYLAFLGALLLLTLLAPGVASGEEEVGASTFPGHKELLRTGEFDSPWAPATPRGQRRIQNLRAHQRVPDVLERAGPGTENFGPASYGLGMYLISPEYGTPFYAATCFKRVMRALWHATLFAEIRGPSHAGLLAAVAALEDADPAVRWEAAGMLAGSPEDEPGLDRAVLSQALARLIGDTETDLRLCACASALFHPTAVAARRSAWVKTLEDPDPDVRWWGAFLLGRTGVEVPRAVAFFLGRLDHATAGEYPLVVRSLGLFGAGHPTVVARLRASLHAKDRDVRVEAAGALERLAGDARPALADLLAALGDPDTHVASSAAAAVAAIGRQGSPVARSLACRLRSPTAHGRRAALQGLALLGPRGVPTLCRVIARTQDVPLRLAAIQAAWHTPNLGVDRPRQDPSVFCARWIPALCVALRAREPEVRAAAAEALRFMANRSCHELLRRRALPALIQAFDDPARDVRQEAALAVSYMRREEAIERRVRCAARSRSPRVRRCAALLLRSWAEGFMLSDVQAFKGL